METKKAEYKPDVKQLEKWEDNGILRYKFQSTDDQYQFTIGVIQDKLTGRWRALIPSDPYDIALRKRQDKSIVWGLPLGKDYQQAHQRVLGVLNVPKAKVSVVAKPENVATASQETLFALGDYKASKTASPLAQKPIPTKLAV